MSRYSAEKVYALFDNPANKKIISDISAEGAKIILFSSVETSSVSTDENTQQILNNLTEFDWLIFQDIYTVEFFLQKLEASNIDLFELDELRVCAYGESVADRLRFAQLHADVIPQTTNPDEVFQSLKEYVFEENFETLRFLILSESLSKQKLKKMLELGGANVSELAVYNAEILENDDLIKQKTLLKGGAVDEFIFSSPFDVLNLAHIFPNENLKDILDGITLFAADNSAEQSLKEFRLI